ncbi:MAG: hypothetical protein ABJZ55_00135 [Fuerstiella sp.]
MTENTMTHEMLMQRCVDGELTDDQRQQLLQQLEQEPQAWKELACLYMEDQLFAKAVGTDMAQLHRLQSQAAQSHQVSKPSPMISGQHAKPTVARSVRWKHWFAHPVTSVALCLCVAFLSGMLLRDNASPTITASNASTGSDSIPYRLTSAESDEFPRAVKNALNELGYNQPGISKRSQATSSTYVDRNGRRYLRLIPKDGTGIMVPLDSIQVLFP